MSSKAMSLKAKIKNYAKSSNIAEQVKAIDKSQLLEKKGAITNTEVMDKITKAIQIQIGVFEEYN